MSYRCATASCTSPIWAMSCGLCLRHMIHADCRLEQTPDGRSSLQPASVLPGATTR
jgi:hypothetical protein